MSNKTPKASAKKTKSARKPAPKIDSLHYIVIILTGVALGISVYFLADSRRAGAPVGNQPILDSYCLRLADGDECAYNLEPSATREELTLGLSGRDKLNDREGMLFIFDQPMQQCIWMKDMRFSIDIIWLDEDKKITQLKENVSPDTYPESFCSPKTKYVIELNEGSVKRHGLEAGQKLDF